MRLILLHPTAGQKFDLDEHHEPDFVKGCRYIAVVDSRDFIAYINLSLLTSDDTPSSWYPRPSLLRVAVTIFLYCQRPTVSAQSCTVVAARDCLHATSACYAAATRASQWHGQPTDSFCWSTTRLPTQRGCPPHQALHQLPPNSHDCWMRKSHRPSSCWHCRSRSHLVSGMEYLQLNQV